MIDHLTHFILPAAYELLPPGMASTEASALLLAIALQESALEHRRQVKGPARGFWQFEVIGVAGVLEHRLTRTPAQDALEALVYRPVERAPIVVQRALEHNDVLAAVVARLNLWPLRAQLPARADVDGGWTQYLKAWRPGKPRPATWATNYERAWSAMGAA